MRRKNILLVLLDGCRAQSLGCYGYTARDTSPAIDRLAERGLVAERVYATSNCTMPSVISMMTGVYPALHRATATWGYYDGKYPFLPEILRSSGYQTFFAANAVTAMSPEWGFIRGYDRAYRIGKENNWFKDSAEQARGVRKSSFKHQVKQDLFRIARRYFPDKSEDVRMSAQLKWYRGNDMGGAKSVDCVGRMLKERDQDKPFFMYVNLPVTHHPYLAPAPFVDTWGKFQVTRNLADLNLVPGEFYGRNEDLTQEERRTLVQMYDTCVRYADHCVERIVSMLQAANVRDDTVVILAGDHGGMTFETKKFHGSANFTYEPEIRVPLIVVDGQKGRSTSGLRSVVDLFPTALELAGVGQSFSPVQGKSILSESAGHHAVMADYPRWPLWLAERAGDKSNLLRFWQTNRTMVASDGKKLIWLDSGRHELFDLNADPDEQRNIYDSDTGLPLIERMESFYTALLGPAGRRLEIYDHADIGKGISELPPMSTINPSFNPESIVAV